MTIKYQNALWNNKKVIIGEPDNTEPLNILIGFHGAESTAENMLVQSNRLKLDNTILIFPEGPVDAKEGRWSWWKDGPGQPKSVEEFLDFTNQLIQATQDHFKSLSLNRISLWGFSQGGAASLVYALLGSQNIYKVASVCGFLPELPQTDSKGVSTTKILGIFGSNDEVVPSFLADYALEEMKKKGHLIESKETSQTHELNAENLNDVCIFFNS